MKEGCCRWLFFLVLALDSFPRGGGLNPSDLIQTTQSPSRSRRSIPPFAGYRRVVLGFVKRTLWEHPSDAFLSDQRKTNQTEIIKHRFPRRLGESASAPGTAAALPLGLWTMIYLFVFVEGHRWTPASVFCVGHPRRGPSRE